MGANFSILLYRYVLEMFFLADMHFSFKVDCTCAKLASW